jgi:hypothetical protein
MGMNLRCVAAVAGLLLVGVCGPVVAQLGPSQLKAHRARIENSRRLGKTIWSYDTIFHKGEAYGILRSVGRANRDFSVFALNNPQELILVQNLMRVRQGSIEVMFRFLDEEGGQGIMRSSIDVRDFVCQVLVDEKLLTPAGLNRPAVNHFLRKYGTEDTGPARLPEGEDRTTSDADEVVEALVRPAQPAPAPAGGPARNRSALIMVIGKEIKQDHVVIGRYTQETDFDLPHMHRYTIYDPQGQLVATFHEEKNNDLTILTVSDKKQHSLVYGSADFHKADLPVTAVTVYLVKFFYL